MLKQTSSQAEALLELQKQANTQPFWGSREMITLLLAVVFLAAILFIWAAYIRKPKRRSISRSLENKNPSNDILRISQSRDRQDSRSKRRSRRRNPTLAETGGLPPLRDGNSFSNLR